MRTHLSIASPLVAGLVLLGGLDAQTSSTLPKGFDTKVGNSQVWAGWDVLRGSTVYNPARTIDLIDQEVFPWGKSGKVINSLRVRRDESFISGLTSAHTKTVKMWMSINGHRAQRPDSGSFAANHGTRLTQVVGTATKAATINYKATPSGALPPFDVVFPFQAPYVVLRNARVLAIELRTYGTTPASGRWRADAFNYGDLAKGGTSTTLGATECLNPGMTYAHLTTFIGGGLTHRYNTNRPNTPVVGLLGAKLTTPIKIPRGNSNCQLWTLPILALPFVTGSVAAGTVDINFGGIPDDTKLIGVRIVTQLALVDSQGLGLSRGRETSIGSGYQPTTHGCRVRSYGANTSKFNGKLVDPDTETDPRFFHSRTVIWKVN